MQDIDKHKSSQAHSIHAPISLEQIFERNDTWKGDTKTLFSQKTLDTGFEALNEQLHNKGWPLSTLIDVSFLSNIRFNQNKNTMNEALLSQGASFFLFSTAINQSCRHGHHIALINPPAQPYGPNLAREISLEQLLLVRPENKNDFIACFKELSRSTAFNAIMAWSPKQSLTYTELRKLQLASKENQGLSIIFRSSYTANQASPANLRLHTHWLEKSLQVHISKQKGSFNKAYVTIDLPNTWLKKPKHHLLGCIKSPTLNSSTTKNIYHLNAPTHQPL